MPTPKPLPVGTHLIERIDRLEHQLSKYTTAVQHLAEVNQSLLAALVEKTDDGDEDQSTYMDGSPIE